jgi:hypothetical protein
MNPQALAPTSLESSRIFPRKERKEGNKERKLRTNRFMSWMIRKITNFFIFIAAPARGHTHWALPTLKSWRTGHPILAREHAHWVLPTPKLQRACSTPKQHLTAFPNLHILVILDPFLDWILIIYIHSFSFSYSLTLSNAHSSISQCSWPYNTNKTPKLK